MLGILRCAVPDRNTVDGVWTEFSYALGLNLSFRAPLQCFLYARGIEMSEKSVLEPIEAERTGPHGHPITNNLLLSLPDHEFELVRGELEFLDLPDHMDLHQPGQDVQYAYFPNRGMISLVVATEDGRTVEVGVVGREGFSGAALAVGLRTSSVREMVQIAGDGFRIGAEAVAKLMRTAPEMRMTMGRYAVILGMQISQTAACNRLHTVEQRLARWLLVTRDRVDSGFLPITHDFLATMLGTDRPTVSLAASTMQKKGILEYKRGAVKIVDRKKLQERACECYQVIEQFNPVLGIP
jgi:CRP-like cAMP-binding protein